MAKKKRSTAANAQGQAVPASLPAYAGPTAEELAEIERMQEEEDAALLRQMEEEEKLVLQQAAETKTAREGGGGEDYGGRKKSSKDRFKDREARRQAAMESALPPRDEAQEARMQREVDLERVSIAATSKELGLDVHEIAPDGHCLYSAVADQLALLGLIPQDDNTHQTTRSAAATYIASHADDFLPFLTSISGEDMAGSTEDGMLTEAGLLEYVRRVRDSGDWGGEPEILALSRSFNIPIHVIQTGPPTIVSHAPDPNDSGTITPEKARATRAVKITYHTRMYGLGAHYNSLRQPGTAKKHEPHPAHGEESPKHHHGLHLHNPFSHHKSGSH